VDVIAMTDDQLKITFRVGADEAAALLKFLRRVLRADIKRALDHSAEDVKAFEAASERLRVVLRDVVEPRLAMSGNAAGD
jgi:hypothetical protein